MRDSNTRRKYHAEVQKLIKETREFICRLDNDKEKLSMQPHESELITDVSRAFSKHAAGLQDSQAQDSKALEC